MLTVLLIAGLVTAALLLAGRDPGAADREACAYLSAESLLAERAGSAERAMPAAPSLAEACGDAGALAAGERWDLYWQSAAAPLAVSIDARQEDPPRGDEVAIGVTVINDTARPESVDLRLYAVDRDGAVLASSRLQRLEIPANSRTSASPALRIPNSGPYLLAAELRPRNPDLVTAWSRRKVDLGGPGAAVPDPPFASPCCGGGS